MSAEIFIRNRLIKASSFGRAIRPYQRLIKILDGELGDLFDDERRSSVNSSEAVGLLLLQLKSGDLIWEARIVAVKNVTTVESEGKIGGARFGFDGQFKTRPGDEDYLRFPKSWSLDTLTNRRLVRVTHLPSYS